MNTCNIDILREPGRTEDNLEYGNPRVVSATGAQRPGSRPDTPVPAAFGGKIRERIPHVIGECADLPCSRPIRKDEITPEELQHTNKMRFSGAKEPAHPHRRLHRQVKVIKKRFKDVL